MNDFFEDKLSPFLKVAGLCVASLEEGNIYCRSDVSRALKILSVSARLGLAET